MHTLDAVCKEVMGGGTENKQINQQGMLSDGGNQTNHRIEQQEDHKADDIHRKAGGQHRAAVGLTIHTKA